MTYSKDNWLNSWKEGCTPWDLGEPHPATAYLLKCIQKLQEWNKEQNTKQKDEDEGTATEKGKEAEKKEKTKAPKHVLIPGAGRAHDAQVFLAAGYKVTALDIAKEAIALGKEAFPHENFTYLKGDILSLKEASSFEVDMIFDRAVLCALQKEQREMYSKFCLNALKPNGLFVSIPFCEFPFLEREENAPPFTLSKDELMQLFASSYDVLTLEPYHFKTETQNFKEHLMILQKR